MNAAIFTYDGNMKGIRITLKLYGLSLNVSHITTSGAIQYGVPIKVSCFCRV